MVPRQFVRQIPPSHQLLSGSAQKTSFLKITLPLILAENEEIMYVAVMRLPVPVRMVIAST